MTIRQAACVVSLACLACQACSSEESGSPSNTSVPTTPPPAMERLIEEGDIVWLDDPILYVLNQTKGLSVVGLGNPAAPLLIGRVGLAGTPVELYLHNGHILALNSGIRNAGASTAGSRLSVVDVTLPEHPVLRSTVALEGQTTNSRMVGDVLYTASDAGRVIESVDVSNPAAARVVDRMPLPPGSHGSDVLATPSVFYVATQDWGGKRMGECAASTYGNDGCTTIIAVDISSPVGALRRGASYSMTGMLKDRWGLDFSDGVLRVLLARGGWWTSGGSLSASLRTFRARTANEIEPLANLSLATERIEKVMAVRFDGPRAYVVTFRQTDPLFAIDISNPASPKVAGHLETPGWLDFIIPRGNRLLGVGRDQDPWTGSWRLQASLYDVSTLGAPRLMGRTLFGDSYSALPDQSDNFAKVVRVVDALGVLLVPYNGSSAGYSSTKTYDGHVEVFSFAGDVLTTLGRIGSTDPILRAVPLPPTYIAAVTETAVGVIQIAPELAVTGAVDLNQAVTPAPGAPSDGGSRD